MRTIKHILITGCIALAVSSCDYLDQQPYEYWQPEETFIDYNKTIQMLNSVYVSMPNGYQSNYTAFLDASTDDGAYVVEGPRIEKMLGYTNLDSEKGFDFFQKFLKQQGILKELEKLGIEEGDTVRMYGLEFDYYK